MKAIAPFKFNAFGYLAEVCFSLLGQPIYTGGHGLKVANSSRRSYATAMCVFIL